MHSLRCGPAAAGGRPSAAARPTAGTSSCSSIIRRPFASAPPARCPRRRLPQLHCRAEQGNGASGKGSKAEKKQEEYVEALKKGGVDQKTARDILKIWEDAGAESDPNQLRKLFFKQSLVPITASVVQLLFDAGAAYSIFISASFFALGPPFWGRVPLVYLLDFLAIYFAIGLFFDIVTLTSVLITTAKLGTAPMAFYDAVKAIASPAGAPSEGLKLLEKAKTAASSIKVAQALDAISAMLEAAGSGKQPPTAPVGAGQALKSADTLTNLAAYLTLLRAEKQGGFDPATVGLSEAEAANIALVFGQYDLDDNGKLDSGEFIKMLAVLGVDVSSDEAAAAMEVMDENKDGLVTFDEFAKWFASQPNARAALARK